MKELRDALTGLVFKHDSLADRVAEAEARDKERYCMARFEVGRAYPCSLPVGHDGEHKHPMDLATVKEHAVAGGGSSTNQAEPGSASRT